MINLHFFFLFQSHLWFCYTFSFAWTKCSTVVEKKRFSAEEYSLRTKFNFRFSFVIFIPKWWYLIFLCTQFPFFSFWGKEERKNVPSSCWNVNLNDTKQPTDWIEWTTDQWILHYYLFQLLHSASGHKTLLSSTIYNIHHTLDSNQLILVNC